MKNIKKILELIRKTGDRYIFEDEQGEVFVIMPVQDYENVVFNNNLIKTLSEEELMNKINKDIALWKAGQEAEQENINWQDDDHDLKTEETDTEDRYYFEPVDEEE